MAKQYTCDVTDCAFQVRSENEDEMVQFVQEHAQNTHGMSTNADDIRGGMQTV